MDNALDAAVALVARATVSGDGDDSETSGGISSQDLDGILRALINASAKEYLTRALQSAEAFLATRRTQGVRGQEAEEVLAHLASLTARMAQLPTHNHDSPIPAYRCAAARHDLPPYPVYCHGGTP